NVAWAEDLIQWIDSGRECSVRTLVDDLIKLSNRGEEINAQVNYGEDIIDHIYDQFIVKWTDSDKLVDVNKKMGTFESVKDKTFLTPEIKKRILKDFKKWSGGLLPSECTWSEKSANVATVKGYIDSSLPGPYEKELLKEIKN